MTWRALLAGARPSPPAPVEKPAVPKEEDTALLKPPPPPPAPPAVAIAPVPAPEIKPVPTPQTNSDSSGFFQLPPSPRSQPPPKPRQEQLETISFNPVVTPAPAPAPALPVPPRLNPNSPEARWEPPNSGFLLHQNPKSPLTMKPISTWFIDETPNQDFIATSPVKEAFRSHFQEQPTSVDRQKARLLFAQDFVEGIARLEEERKKLDPFLAHHSAEDDAEEDSSMDGARRRTSNLQVFVRKRPMPETKNDDFDVIRTESEEESSKPSVVVYNTEIKHDLRKKEVRPVIFGPFSSCFSESCQSGEVYQRAVKSLVETAKGGGIATLLIFGQVSVPGVFRKPTL